ncbi:unnamed protein product [Alopecurus aequalis]
MMMAGPSKKPRQSGAGLAGFAARLTKRLADENPRANLVFSPLSIYAAVALLAPGARGDTLDEILGLLGARSRDELAESISTMVADALKDRSDSGGPSVAFACGVWNEKTRPLKPAYREAVVGAYRAEARALDFRGNAEEAAEQINAWVADVTRNLIKDVVRPDALTGKTDVVLANAIYFEGKWDLPFYERNTRERPFHRLDGAAIDAPFMYNSSRHFVAVYDGFKVLKLQYKMLQQDYGPSYSRTQYSMCIFLPDTYDGLPTLLDEITSRPSFVQEHLPWSKVKVRDFGVPKFKLEFTSIVTEILKRLGLRLPFDTAADLSDMVEPSPDGLPFLVKDVLHKAVIEEPTVDFVADHPFAYFIVEEASGTILFAGHVVDPTNGSTPVRTGEPTARGYELPPMIRNPPTHLDDLAGAMKNTRSTGLATLAAGLARSLAEGSADSNLIFSPMSIYTVLMLVAAGARAATLDEILRVLGAGSPEEVVSVTAAELLQDRSESGGPSVAFACGATRNLIDSVLPPGSIKPATTRVVLGNAVYFKGTWEDQPFDRRHTVHIPFHRLDRSHVDVPYMQSWEKQFVAVHDGFKVLKLRYRMAARDHDRTSSAAHTVDFDPYTYNRVPYGGHNVPPPYINLLHASAAEAIAAYRPLVQPMQMSDAPPFLLHHGWYIPPPPPFAPYSHVPPPPYPPQFASHGAFNRAGPYGYPMPNPYGPRPHVAAPWPRSMYAAPPQPADPTQFSMCIFLPDARDGLRALLDTIASRPGFLHDHLPEQRVNVREFRLPRFKLSFHGSVVAVLKKLGLALPFCERADLSGMAEDDGSGLPVLVDDVIHRAVIEVNEEGTKAAAVTMGISPEELDVRREPQLNFVADHPFAFYIMEEATGAVVFAGHVLDPSKEE